MTATVVRVAAPDQRSGRATSRWSTATATIEGFVGGVCAQHSVRLYSLQAIETRRAAAAADPARRRRSRQSRSRSPMTAGRCRDASREDGTVTVQQPVPVRRRDRGVPGAGAAGAARARRRRRRRSPARCSRLGAQLGFEMVAVGGTTDRSARCRRSRADRRRARARRARRRCAPGSRPGCPYVGLVASPKRGAAVLDELRADGVPEELVARIDTPAGLDIGARTPAEIALSILAQSSRCAARDGDAVARRVRRRSSRAMRRRPAVDPICGMTVVVVPDTPSSSATARPSTSAATACQRAFDASSAAA